MPLLALKYFLQFITLENFFDKCCLSGINFLFQDISLFSTTIDRCPDACLAALIPPLWEG